MGKLIGLQKTASFFARAYHICRRESDIEAARDIRDFVSWLHSVGWLGCGADSRRTRIRDFAGPGWIHRKKFFARHSRRRHFAWAKRLHRRSAAFRWRD